MFASLDDPRGPFRPDAAFRAGVRRRAARLRRRRRLAVAMTTLSATVLVAVLGTALYVRGVDGDIDRVEVVPPAGAALDGPVNVLLVGTDGARADAIMVARIEADGGVSLVSIPRDLFDPSTGDRINAALAGGPQAAVDAVERLLGVPVDHYISLEMGGFAALVDAVGGLDLSFPAPVRDQRSGLVVDAAGCTTLDGAAALSLVRSRDIEFLVDGRWAFAGTGDLGRTARERVVLGAAVAEVLAVGADPVALDRLAGVLADHATVDAGLSLGRLVELARAVAGGPGVVTDELLPVTPLTLPGGALVLDLAAESAAVLARYGAVGPPAATQPAPVPPVAAEPDIVAHVEPCAG